jgi:putative cell wall-binding protein
MLASTFVGLLIAAVIVPLVQAPAEASTVDLTISGTVVADPSSNHLVQYYDFGVALTRVGSKSSTVYQQFRGPDFSISAPTPGHYTLFISPVPSYPASPWAGAWFGDTPFPWHATDLAVDGVTPITDLAITVTEAGSISGQITTPPPDLNHGITADAFLRDPATGLYERISGISRDFDGPYVIDNLPRGSYAVRFGHFGGNGHEQTRAYPSSYFGGSRYLAQSQPVEVTTGGAVEGIDGALEPWSFDVTRTAGADRYETSVRISEGAFGPGVPVAYLASGASWADALSAAPAAAHRGGPLLLTSANEVPAPVLSELARLQPAEVVIAGGPSVVSNAVFDTLVEQGYTVRRVAGADRYDTSRSVALDAFEGAANQGSTWLATGRGFADALSAASDASRVDIPLILVDGASTDIDAATLEAFTELGISQFNVAGGPVSIGDSYFASLERIFGRFSASRVAGADRYETSRLIAERFISRSPSVSTGRAFLASGSGYADALSAAPVAGLTLSPLLLTPGNCVPSASISSLVGLDAFLIELVGGKAVLGAGVENLTPC